MADGRYALIVPAQADDEDVSALAGVLKRRKVGGYTVETAAALEQVEAFLAGRERADTVFVYVADDAPVTAREVSAALKDCPSQHVLVVLEGREKIAVTGGRAVLSGAGAGAVADALQDADLDRDGKVAARELYLVLRDAAPEDQQPTLRSKLQGSFKVAGSRHARRAGPSIGPTTPLLLAAIALLVIGLLLPWFYGGSGLKLGFWPDSAFRNRVAPVSALVLALYTAVFLLRRWHAYGTLIVAAGATYGCLLAWFWFQENADYGIGIVVSMLGPLALVIAAGLEIVSVPAHRDEDSTQSERYAAGAAAAAGVLVLIEVSPAIGTDYFVLCAGLAAGVPLVIPDSGRLRAMAPMFAGAMILTYDVFGPLAFYPLFACLLAIGAGWTLLSKF